MQTLIQNGNKEIVVTNVPKLCQTHKKSINQIISNSSDPTKALLCPDCFSNIREIHTIFDIDQFLDTIKEERQMSVDIFLKEKNEYLTVLNRLLDEIKIYHDNWLAKINELKEFLEKSVININKIQESFFTIDFMEELKNSFSKNEEIKKSLKIINTDYLKQSKCQFANLITMKELHKCFETLKELTFKFSHQTIQNPSLSLKPEISVNHLDLYQPKIACATKVSKNKLITSCDKDLMIYSINARKFNLQKTLVGHKATVQCLVENKTQNWIASGDSKGIIYTWKLGDQLNIAQFEKEHETITGLILNDSQNQLISYGSNSICVWSVDTNTNFHNLQSKIDNQENVQGATMNFEESLLVTCHDNKIIKLWKKNINWCYLRQFFTENTPIRVCFLCDRTFLCQFKEIGILQVFRIFQNYSRKFAEIELNKLQEDQKLSLFPLTFNIKRRIIVSKHNRFVYVIRWLLEGQFEISKTIDCLCSEIYGSLSDESDMLGIWSNQNHQIYEIQYKN